MNTYTQERTELLRRSPTTPLIEVVIFAHENGSHYAVENDISCFHEVRKTGFYNSLTQNFVVFEVFE